MGNGNPNSGGGTPLQSHVFNSDPSYPCKKMSYMSLSSLYHHHNHEIGSQFGGVYGNSNRIASGNSLKSTTDGVMGGSGKMLFTATQWQELQRQTMIYKYIIASIPVPPQLLLSLSTQSNRMTMGLRFSSGSDPEPWRCRRTDGKKWRCSRDVAPNQKYCEHHSRKTRSRSRKPVEIQSHNSKQDYHPLLPSADTKNNNFNNPSINSSNEQTSDWFLKSGAIDVSQFQQPVNSPSGSSKRGETIKYDHEEHKSCLDHNNPYLNTTGISTNAGKQHFIDDWSRIGSGDDCALTLSMQSGRNGIEFDDHQSFHMAVLDDEKGRCGDVSTSQHQWLNQVSWEGGGPLGEALCLGIDSPEYNLPNVPLPFL